MAGPRGAPSASVPPSAAVEPAIPGARAVEAATRVSNGVATAHAAVASGGTEVKRASTDAPAAPPGTPDARGAAAEARRLEPAASPIGEGAPIKRKKSYTFGVYKATKIALGLKKTTRTVAASSSFAERASRGSESRDETRDPPHAGTREGDASGVDTVDVLKGPWHEVEDPAPWSGPPVPTAGPDESAEPFMAAAAKTLLRGFALQPWEGAAVTGPAVLAVIDCGLVDASVRPELNRPDTRPMPEDRRVFHMRRAVADALKTPLFAFALRLFEGPRTDPAVACDRFLRRLLKGCGGAVYCSIGEPPGSAKAYEKMPDSKLAGAALFLRVFLVRFAKRFPQQHGFVHPVVDAPDTRERLIETLGAGFQSWSFMPATASLPAAIVVRMTNDGVRALTRAPQPHSWIAVNHFYEFCITQPSRELSGHPSIFIIDLQKLTFSVYTSTNIKAIAGQLVAAMFHPEPFSAFVVAHAPSVIQFVWGVAKLFLTESARQKFVIQSGSASSHFHKALGVPLEEIPDVVGGTARGSDVLSAADLLRRRAQDDAVAAYVDAYGADIASHAAGTFHAFSKLPRHLAGSELFRVGSSSEPGTPTEGAGAGPSPGLGTNSPGTNGDTGDAALDLLRRGRLGGARAPRRATPGKIPTARDLRAKISTLAGKLEKAGVVPAAHEAARAAAVAKLRGMKRQLFWIFFAKIARAAFLLLAGLWIAYHAAFASVPVATRR